MAEFDAASFAAWCVITGAVFAVSALGYMAYRRGRDGAP